ncbi:unnamed protein product [Paramecium sonneborni]|uniref:Protein kinase domain-containing protein n=1 Tax=Paramecium sonneborni TaxID=65129 RepID=A0A8S1NI73_9CILI|nr:unnamed protein product [Paramecium sonneborni]
MRRNNNRTQNNMRVVSFQSVFGETLPSTSVFWHPDTSPRESQLTILQGQLLFKNENDSWESYLFELQPDRMFRFIGDQTDCCYLRGCFLKKFNHYDAQYPSYKYGFRLQMGQQLAFFVTDILDQFKKWFMMLKRFCILEKFTRKYRVIAQLRYNDPIFQQVCFNCVRLSDAQYYLVKIISKEMSPQQKNMMFKELMHLRRLNHPQLMRLIEIYEDEMNIYQVFDPYMGGDLRQHLRETQLAQEVGGQVEEKVLADMMYGLIGAIAHMHQRGVFHRDIKLENLFVPENKRLPFVLLSNFCYSESFKLNGQNQGSYKKCGTPGYVAPEIFRSRNYDQKIDVFSLGIVYYILVFGKMPFEGSDQDDILRANEKCEIDFKAEKRLCKNLSQSGMDMMKKMLNKEPTQRFTSAQCLNHHWFIKMKCKDETKPRNQFQQQRSLSTIIENSEMELTQSFIRPFKEPSQYMQSKKNLPTQVVRKNQQKQDTIEKIDKEFIYDTLEGKMNYINQETFVKAPSKINHR